MMLALLLAITPPSSAYIQIRNHGADAGAARIINCSGTGVACSVDTTTGLATLTVNTPDAGVAIPNCDAGYANLSNATAFYCTNTITNATQLAANPADCSSNQYATTIAANGNLSCSQVSYSQLSGTPIAGGAVPQVQYNADGGLAGITNVTTDSAHLWLTTETSYPSAPATNAVVYNYAQGANLPPTLGQIDSTMAEPLPVGIGVGPSITMEGSRNTWLCQGHHIDGWGSSVIVNTGSSTGEAFASFGNTTGINAFDGGTFFGRQRTIASGTNATSNTSAGTHYAAFTSWLGNGTHTGGFDSMANVWLAGFPATRVFCGFANTTATLSGTVEWSTLTNTVYIGADGADSNLQACSNDASGSATCSDLGSNFPKSTGGYQIRLTSAPDSQTVTYNVERLDAVVSSAHGVINSDIPIRNALLSWQCAIGNSDAGQAAKIYFGGERQCSNW